MHEVIMPKLGLTMETGVIEKWHKKEGDKVETGEVLFEVMTDKVSLEVEAYNSGILRKIIRSEGEEVPVTEVIAFIGSEDEDIPETTVNKPGTAPSGTPVEAKRGEIKISPLAKNIAEKKGIDISIIKGTGPGGRIVKEDVEAYLESGLKTPGQPEPPVAVGKDDSQRLKISPLARNLAKEMGIDYSKEHITGTGPGGRIIKEDIIAFAEKMKASTGAQGDAALSASAKSHQAASATISTASTEGAAGSTVKIKSSTPLKGIRKLIAERMVHSKQHIPHISLASVMDMDALVAVREKIKDKASNADGIKITYTDFIIKACATVLAEQLNVNASLVDETCVVYEDINIGLAVAAESGLIVPTIYNADRLSVFEIARKRTELVEKAKQGKLTIEEITNATFTVSNLGMFGIRMFTAIINPPQGAILAVGELYIAPAFVGDSVVPKHFMEVSLAVDHRIIDGADGARYLQKLKEIMENPGMLLI